MSESHYGEMWVAKPGERSAKSFGSVDGLFVQNCTADGKTSEWGLKISKSYDVNVIGCRLSNGFDRAFDMVRGGDVIISDCIFSITNGVRKKFSWWRLFAKECDVDIKGGVSDVEISNCTVDSILLGDYSMYDKIPNHPATRRVVVKKCINPNGGKVTVRVWHGNHITVDGNCRLIVFPKWMTWVYFTYRKWTDKSKLPVE